MIHDFTRSYLLHGLAGSPTVLGQLMTQIPADAWDRRPDPERFTLREVVAHLADWERVWQERVETALTADPAVFPDRDPGQLALDGDYASADPETSVRQFQERRAELVRQFRELSSEDWQRSGKHPIRGILTIEDLAVTALGHDGYHLNQVSEWIQSA